MANHSIFSNLFAAILFVALTPFFFAQPAHAYLDPGTASFIIQTLFGLVLAGGLTIARFKDKVLSMFRPKGQDPKSDETPTETP